MTKKYDVVIIGAGISGLICGCYLAKEGCNVLIAERKSTVGGCCTSFKRDEHIFDAFAHAIGGMRENSGFSNLLIELDVLNRLKIRKHDPSDIIVSPDCRICFWSDVNRTIHELQEHFHKEADAIKNFFNFLSNAQVSSSFKLVRLTFEDILNDFFTDSRLKSILSVLVFGDTGLPASLISSFTAIKLYQEFILDGGYYLEGGIQAFPEILVDRFQELGGVLHLSTRVERILNKNNKIQGVLLNNGHLIGANYVVSSCDVTSTFRNLLENSETEIHCLRNMQPSLSMFLDYFGIDGDILEISRDMNSTVWYMFHYDIERMYLETKKGNIHDVSWFLSYGSPDRRGFTISLLAPMQSETYWQENKKKLSDNLLQKIEHFIPGMADHVIFDIISTPQTIFNWTGNYRGAAYGWESVPDQLMINGFTKITPIQGLYLTGHWTTQAFGISGVAWVGRSTAKRLLRKKKTQC